MFRNGELKHCRAEMQLWFGHRRIRIRAILNIGHHGNRLKQEKYHVFTSSLYQISDEFMLIRVQSVNERKFGFGNANSVGFARCPLLG